MDIPHPTTGPTSIFEFPQDSENTPLLRKNTKPRSYNAGSSRSSRSGFRISRSRTSSQSSYESRTHSPARTRYSTSTTIRMDEEAESLLFAGSSQPCCFSSSGDPRPDSPCMSQRRASEPPPSCFNPVSWSLENTGSVARDHLASERTFLAYVRTSLAIASCGVALVQLFTIHDTKQKVPDHLRTFAAPLGGLVVCTGLAVLALGVVRYFSIQKALVKGAFPVATLSMAGVGVAVATFVSLVFAILVAGSKFIIP